MHSRHSHLRRAFTLIELILVLALVAIIVTIAVPSLSNFVSSQGVGNSANQVMALARWARSEAIGQGVSFRLNFDPVKQTYWLTRQNGASFEYVLQDNQTSSSLGLSSGDNSNTTTFADVGQEPGKAFKAPQGTTFTCMLAPHPDGSYYVEFQPTGRCDPGTIQFKGATKQVIEVGCLTGSEQYHVLTDDEKLLMAQMLVPPAQAR
jgi:prepilin-type N-terminal cleavage/methylation domain-containing protein